MKRAIPLLVAAFAAQPLVAQSAVTAPARFEIMAGGNFANLSTPSGVDEGSDTRTGLVVGIGLVKPFAPGWSFQPELTYSMKGAKSRDVDGDVTVKFSYIELPLLLRYELQSQSAVRPFVHAGPALAFKASCGIDATTVEGKQSLTCDEFDNPPKSFDVGLMFGGGLAFRHMQHTLSLGVRYNLGLMEIADGAESKHRVLSVIGTFEWPWGK